VTRPALGKEEHMPKGASTTKVARNLRLLKGELSNHALRDMVWRLDRLERQVKILSELVRVHAEDADRLVRIVAEDRDVLRQELLKEHQAKVRARKRARTDSAKVGLTS